MPSVMIVNSGGHCAYARMFKLAGWEVLPFGYKELRKCDLVQFTGGEDVTPYFYGEDTHPRTHFNESRDFMEASFFTIAKMYGKKMAGICRGGQFLNVMSGGAMYQDVDGHAIHGTHECFDRGSGQVFNVTSTHHQMMLPSHNGRIIATADQSTRREYMQDGEIKVHDSVGGDVEVVYYRHTDALCFQPHPEFVGATDTSDYYFSLLNRIWGF